MYSRNSHSAVLLWRGSHLETTVRLRQSFLSLICQIMSFSEYKETISEGDTVILFLVSTV